MAVTQEDLDNLALDLQTIEKVAMVGTNADSVLNRNGDSVDTLVGRLRTVSYLAPIAHAAGISFTSSDLLKTVTYNGFQYAPRIDSIPFTTTSSFATDSSKFTLINTGALDAQYLSYTPVSPITSTNVKDAVDEIVEKTQTIQSSDVTYQVGSGGSFTTLNEALTAMSRRVPEYINTAVRVTLNLKTGFVIAEQIILDAIDLGFVTITSTDATVSITPASITTTVESEKPIFSGKNGAVLPFINFTIDVSNTGISGVLCTTGSQCSTGSNFGVNSGKYGVFATKNSSIYVASADLTENVIGVKSQYGSTIQCVSTNITLCTTYGVIAANGGKVSLTSCSCRKNGTTDQRTDMNVTAAGIIQLNSTTGGVSYGTSNTLATKNTINAGGLIIG